MFTVTTAEIRKDLKASAILKMLQAVLVSFGFVQLGLQRHCTTKRKFSEAKKKKKQKKLLLQEADAL